MIRLEIKHILDLHKEIIEVSGGAKDILNMDSLEGSLLSIYATFGGVDLYPLCKKKRRHYVLILLMTMLFGMVTSVLE